MDCLFCDIVQKKKDAKIIYEDDSAVAVLDVFPHARGHVLVLSRRHVETILELSEKECGPFLYAIQQVAALLKKQLHPQGFTIGINHGKVSGQIIQHLHVHIMPRYEEDGGGSLHSVVNAPSSDSIEDIYNKIIKQ